jgi:hypothetical protein
MTIDDEFMKIKSMYPESYPIPDAMAWAAIAKENADKAVVWAARAVWLSITAILLTLVSFVFSIAALLEVFGL